MRQYQNRTTSAFVEENQSTVTLKFYAQKRQLNKKTDNKKNSIEENTQTAFVIYAHEHSRENIERIKYTMIGEKTLI